MRTAILLGFLSGAFLFAGCDKQGTAGITPTLVLAANDRGRPQFDYFGPGAMNYSHGTESFSFQIGSLGGTRWVTGKGEMKLGRSNDVVVTIQSQSDRPFDIQLWGVSTNNNKDLPEDIAKETVHIAAGDQKVTVGRFIIWTYDFMKR